MKMFSRAPASPGYLNVSKGSLYTIRWQNGVSSVDGVTECRRVSKPKCHLDGGLFLSWEGQGSLCFSCSCWPNPHICPANRWYCSTIYWNLHQASFQFCTRQTIKYYRSNLRSTKQGSFISYRRAHYYFECCGSQHTRKYVYQLCITMYRHAFRDL